MSEKTIAKRAILSRDNIYQKMIDEIEDYAIFLLDLNGNVQTWNSGAEKTKGYTAEEMIGKNFSQLFTKTDRDAFLPERLIDEAKRVGKVSTEGLRVKKDGGLIWVSSAITALHDDQTNEVIGFTKVVRDITERKKAEDELEFLSSIVRNIHDTIICADTNNKITDWNKPAEEFLGWKKEEAIGKTVLELLKLKYPNDDREDVLRAFYSKGFWQGETIYYTKSGEPLHMLVTASSIRNSDGVITGSIMLSRDITDRRKVEEALALLNSKLERRIKERTEEIFKKQKLFQSLIENDYTLTALLDKNLQTIYRSPSASIITGWEDTDRERLSNTLVPHPDEKQIHVNMVKEMRANPGKLVHVTARTKHKDGHYIWLEGTGINRLDDPYINAFVVNMRDVTEQKNLKMRSKQPKRNTVY